MTPGMSRIALVMSKNIMKSKYWKMPSPKLGSYRVNGVRILSQKGANIGMRILPQNSRVEG